MAPGLLAVVLLSTIWTCTYAAMDMMSMMDSTVDPCTDFYRFSCGNYEKQVTLPEDKIMVAPLRDMDELLKEQLRGKEGGHWCLIMSAISV